MLKLLHTKLDKPKLLTTFPNNSTGNDGDIVISTISGKGTYICVKSNGRWYAANKMEDLSNVGKSSFSKLSLNKLTVKEVENAGSDTDKFLVLDSGNQLKFRTGSETLSDIGALGSLTFGIANTNAVKIDSSSVADDEYARFTASGLESRSTAEVLSDIGAQPTVTAGTNCTFSGATLNVDDAFITNDADDTMAGTLTIDKDTTATTGGNTYGLNIDYDHTGICASGQSIRNYGISLAINSDSPTHVGSVLNFGIDNTVTAGTSGTQSSIGINNTVTGADTNTGIYQKVTDGGTDLKFVSSANIGNYFSIATTADGATTIATVDGTASAGHLTLQPDGDLKVISYTGISKFIRGTNISDYFSISVDGNGGAILATIDAAGTDAGLTLSPDGILKTDAEDGGISIKEIADAGTDTNGYGQVWVHDTTPNELCFTDDAGTDIIGIGKYEYDIKFIGYNGYGVSSYLPINGYIFDQTSTTSRNEYHSFIAPYNGIIEKVSFRSEIAQDGNLRLDVLESADGTEVPGTGIFRGLTTVDIADDTYQELDMANPTVGTAYAPLTKGRIYVLYLICPSAPQDTNVTVVFKWDITS